MNEKFDELARGLAQSVTRRAALKKFGVGIVGMALACFGLASNAKAKPSRKAAPQCKKACDHCRGYPWGCSPDDSYCIGYCANCCTVLP